MISIPETMQAVLLTAHGGPDVLNVVNDHPVPAAAPDEVLIRVGACAVNNTDINTRIGWYSKAVRDDTEAAASGTGVNDSADFSWAGAGIDFPRIQGADICGIIEAVGERVAADRIGERAIVTAMQPRPSDENGLNCITVGSEDFVVTGAERAHAISSDLTDTEFPSFPCAYSTAENMLERARLAKGERVVITGASGGVGSAAVQLAKRRGCHVTALSSLDKVDFVRNLGADAVVDRKADLSVEIGAFSTDVCVDVVAGPAFAGLLDILKRGGRHVCAGAIAGPITELDVRTLYLKDLSLFGSTWQPPQIMQNLVAYIERGEIRPLVSKTYPLSAIDEAQADFISKTYPGKLVLVPDCIWTGDASPNASRGSEN